MVCLAQFARELLDLDMGSPRDLSHAMFVVHKLGIGRNSRRRYHHPKKRGGHQLFDLMETLIISP
jgi:hypothetical protein